MKIINGKSEKKMVEAKNQNSVSAQTSLDKVTFWDQNTHLLVYHRRVEIELRLY